MGEHLDRRHLIGTTTAVIATLASNHMAEALQGARQSLHCVVVENNTLNNDGYSVSMLAFRDLDKHLSKLSDIRKKISYRRHLKFSSTDRRKIPYAEMAIAYFVATPDLKGHIVRVDKFTNWHGHTAAARREIYFGIYRRLFDSIQHQTRSETSVHLWQRSPNGIRDQQLIDVIKEKLGPRSSVSAGGRQLEGDTDDIELLRFASLLFGTIARDLEDKGGHKRVSTTKLKIRNTLRAALRVPNLSHELLVSSGKFGVVTVSY